MVCKRWESEAVLALTRASAAVIMFLAWNDGGASGFPGTGPRLSTTTTVLRGGWVFGRAVG